MLLACGDDEAAPSNSLQNFVGTSTGIVSDSSVIACAGGAGDSINIYYYPEPGFSNHKLWQLTNSEAEPSNFSNYIEVEANKEDLFNGYLAFFPLTGLEAETWFIVTGESSNELTIAQPIKVKQFSAPTELNPDVLIVDNTNPLEPKFDWQDGSNEGTVIYFQVVSDAEENLVSGTYTFDKSWQFYDLSNVVLNIRDINPEPTLETDNTYNFTLMGVSRDNWVNMLVTADFETKE